MSVHQVASSQQAAAGAASMGMQKEPGMAALITRRVTQLHWQYGDPAAKRVRVMARTRGNLCHPCSGDAKGSGLSWQAQGRWQGELAHCAA